MILWFAACAGSRPAVGPAAEPVAASVIPLPSPADEEPILGLVVAAVDEEVTAQAPGQVVEIDVGLGDPVTAGQPLARMSNPGLAHQLERARARASAAGSAGRGASVHAAAAAEESASLDGLGGVVARRDQAQAEATARESAENARALHGAAEEARAELALLEDQSEALALSARTSGRVALLYKRLGESVAVGDPVLRVVSDAEIVRFAAPADVPLRPGQTLRIHTRGGAATTSTVARLAPSVDSAGMILAETSELTDPLRSGDVCRVEVDP